MIYQGECVFGHTPFLRPAVSIKNAATTQEDLPLRCPFPAVMKSGYGPKTRRSEEVDREQQGYLEKSATALLRKGDSRSRTNVFVQRRPSPFLKPRPADAFRDIPCCCFCFVPSASDIRLRTCLFLPFQRDGETESSCVVLHVFLQKSAGL